MEITSVNNDLVKETVKLKQKKYRDLENKFLLEGYKSIKEAFDSGIEIERVFVMSQKSSEYFFLSDKVISTTESVLKKISTTDSAPEAVGVAVQKHYDKDVLKNTQKVILLENIKDVGNLGTILRTATAFKADAVVIFGEAVDIYNPKCVRSSVGNLWKTPVVYIDELAELQESFKEYSRIATLPGAKTYLKDFNSKTPMLVMFGSEAEGLSNELINFATEEVKIEMSENVESLNLSISVAVVLYELFIK